MRILALLTACAALACAQTKLLRFPDIHGDKVVFTYAGDLWTAPAGGGTAVRLTAHPGMELFAKFSPDGKWIAFTGQYDGDEQVYVMPSTGGAPRQLTYYPAKGPLPARWGYDHQVYGWSPDGKQILFRSMRDSWTPSDQHLYSIPLEGGLPKMLPMPTSGAGDYSPDGTKLLYSPLFRDFRTWKRYQGGWAQDLYVFDLKAKTATPLAANTPRTERDPMWIGEKMYFASDRTGTLNLFEFDPAAKKTRQLTDSKEWDVRWPSKGDKTQIVYEMNGELWTLDVKGGAPRKLAINVPNDGLASRPSQLNVGSQVADVELSPKGERAIFVARGDIFTAPIEKGVARNLTRSSGAHDREPAWSPDGRLIAFISDMSGEEELYVVAQEGGAKPEQVTHGGKARRFRPVWSPDSKKIAFSDKDGKLYLLTLADKSVVEVAQETRGMIDDYVWSPDSNYLAYSLSDANTTNSIQIWSAAEKRARRVTSDVFEENSPAWDPDGNYLYFLSFREYAPIISGAEFNYATGRSTAIYALALRKDVKHPFAPESDEVTIEKKEEKKADEKKPEDKKAEDKKAEDKKDKALTIDWDGIEGRVARVPLAGGNYRALMANKGNLIYFKTGTPYYGREPDGQTTINIYSLKDRKETMLAEGVGQFAISADGTKLLVKQGGAYNLYNAAPGGASSRKTVSTAGLTVDRVPQQEWQQIFNEVWRRYRDFFYVKNMHGYDWEALRRQYAPQLEYVAHRSDLNYILGEMVSELNVGHAYISGGDWDAPERPRVALPGVRFELDETSNRYRIAKLFAGQNEETVYRSPLTEVGMNVKPGDYVLAIDGEELAAPANPYRLLRGKAGRAVKFTVNSKPELAGAREVTFQPIADEGNLVYLEMVLRNGERVAKLSGGRVGYIHVPNMGAEGIREFIKWYYPQLKKEALLIDDRANGGGNVSRMLIERLRRELLGVNFRRGVDEASTYPDGVFIGPLACLLNETSASDGDIFPYMFRKAKLGPLIGKRSWGGVVGITNRGNLIDGGEVNVPEFGLASPEGQWVIEGEGVTPDITVENDPKLVVEGRDPQLERGVEELLKKLKTGAKKLPPRPPDPVKTK